MAETETTPDPLAAAPTPWRVAGHVQTGIVDCVLDARGNHVLSVQTDCGEYLDDEALTALIVPVVHVDAAGGPEDGHLWEVTWRCRGSYAVTGEPGHREADWWSEPLTARVRAWDLAAAWGQVAAVPPHRWFAHLDDEPLPDTPEAP